MTDDVLTYLKDLKKAIEDLPDKTTIDSIVDKISEKIISKIERYK